MPSIQLNAGFSPTTFQCASAPGLVTGAVVAEHDVSEVMSIHGAHPVLIDIAANPAAKRISLDAKAQDLGNIHEARDLLHRWAMSHSDSACLEAVQQVVLEAYEHSGIVRRLVNHWLHTLWSGSRYEDPASGRQIVIWDGPYQTEMTSNERYPTEIIQDDWGNLLSAVDGSSVARAVVQAVIEHATQCDRDDPTVAQYTNLIMSGPHWRECPVDPRLSGPQLRYQWFDVEPTGTTPGDARADGPAFDSATRHAALPGDLVSTLPSLQDVDELASLMQEYELSAVDMAPWAQGVSCSTLSPQQTTFAIDTTTAGDRYIEGPTQHESMDGPVRETSDTRPGDASSLWPMQRVLPSAPQPTMPLIRLDAPESSGHGNAAEQVLSERCDVNDPSTHNDLRSDQHSCETALPTQIDARARLRKTVLYRRGARWSVRKASSPPLPFDAATAEAQPRRKRKYIRRPRKPATTPIPSGVRKQLRDGGFTDAHLQLIEKSAGRAKGLKAVQLYQHKLLLAEYDHNQIATLAATKFPLGLCNAIVYFHPALTNPVAPSQKTVSAGLGLRRDQIIAKALADKKPRFFVKWIQDSMERIHGERPAYTTTRRSTRNIIAPPPTQESCPALGGLLRLGYPADVLGKLAQRRTAATDYAQILERAPKFKKLKYTALQVATMAAGNPDILNLDTVLELHGKLVRFGYDLPEITQLASYRATPGLESVERNHVVLTNKPNQAPPGLGLTIADVVKIAARRSGWEILDALAYHSDALRALRLLPHTIVKLAANGEGKQRVRIAAELPTGMSAEQILVEVARRVITERAASARRRAPGDEEHTA
jgi:hypothetical protein